MNTKQVVIPEQVVEITFAEYVGIRIRTRRKQLKMTIDDVAAVADISKPYLSEVETGKRNIGFRKLYILAEVMGRTTDWFTKGW